MLLPPLGAAGSAWIAWVPGPLYTIAAVGDWVDGHLARRRDQVTAAGSRLDVQIDALGLLVASLVAVRNDILPPWYLALGSAFYLFHAGLWLRARLGWPVHRERLRRDPYARFFAGVQMGLVATALYPIHRPSFDALATILMLPTLGMFVREWMIATRR